MKVRKGKERIYPIVPTVYKRDIGSTLLVMLEKSTNYNNEVSIVYNYSIEPSSFGDERGALDAFKPDEQRIIRNGA